METPELNNAWRFVETTGVSIFLTGKAGTGKTTFLRQLRERSRKTMVVVAPTGVAAINAGGVTIHSFFQIPPQPYLPGTQVKDRFDLSKDKRKIIRALDLLVIDEISMVRSDLLDAIDSVLRRYRGNQMPFGGVQLLMIGDLQQLTPVVTPADAEVLRGHYETPYFFGSRALAQTDYVTIQLTQVFRQSDERFLNLLNNIRHCRLTPEDERALRSRLDPSFRPPRGSDFIRLTTHNASADDFNRTQLLLLDTPVREFEAKVEGNFPDFSYPTDSSLTLKVGAQVMFVRNDSSSSRQYFNGKIGHVTALSADEVTVKCPGDDFSITVGAQTWENTRYTVNESTGEVQTEVQGLFKQLPLRLAWAITIHKSQGLTFDHAVIDAGQSFAPGQVYVALSRCRTLEGMVLSSPIGREAIMSDARVESYISHQEAEAQRSIVRLPEIESEYFRTLLLRLFDFTELIGLQERLVRILSESFYSKFPAAVAHQSEAMKGLAAQVREVAEKWQRLILSRPLQYIADPSFGERIKSGSQYFMDKLVEHIGCHLKEVRAVAGFNKAVMKRLDTLRDDFIAAYSAKVLMLKSVAEDGFDVEKYLIFKQRAILKGSAPSGKKGASASSGRSGVLAAQEKRRLREEAREQRRQLREAERERKRLEKASRVPSHRQSFDSFRQGMSVDEIAASRQLARSTIMTHLLQYVESGEIALTELLGDRATEIEAVINRLGIETSVAELQTHLPGVHPTDIYTVLRAVKMKGLE